MLGSSRLQLHTHRCQHGNPNLIGLREAFKDNAYLIFNKPMSRQACRLPKMKFVPRLCVAESPGYWRCWALMPTPCVVSQTPSPLTRNIGQHTQCSLAARSRSMGAYEDAHIECLGNPIRWDVLQTSCQPVHITCSGSSPIVLCRSQHLNSMCHWQRYQISTVSQRVRRL